MLRVAVTGLKSGVQTLPRDVSHYVTRVRRARVGDFLVAFDPCQGVEAEGVVVSAIGGAVSVELTEPRPARRICPMKVTLVQALGKGDKLGRVVRDTTALGVAAIVVARAARSVPGRSSVSSERLARWRTIAVDAARQCGRGDIPAITDAADLASAIAGLPRGTRLCLDESACTGLGHALQPGWTDRLAVLTVGPEGGWAPAERALMAEAGFVAVTLGPFTLRTELAAAVALGVLLNRAMGIEPERGW
jgi:16S rRNA (uracil1498-N3)-methyltransferase